MAKITITITEEGKVVVDADHPGDACERSPLLGRIVDFLQKEGEIDSVQLKYNPQKVKQKRTVKVEEII